MELEGSKIAKAKGLLLSELSTASIIDISHEISFNIVEAAYITKKDHIQIFHEIPYILLMLMLNTVRTIFSSFAFDNHYFDNY